jgi:hypothetical protein
MGGGDFVMGHGDLNPGQIVISPANFSFLFS